MNKNIGIIFIFALTLPTTFAGQLYIVAPVFGEETNILDILSNQIAVSSLSGDMPFFNNSARMNVVVTGYSSTHDQTDSTPFITASGKRVRDGIIAANFLKFGARIQIPEIFGDKIFVVEDRMARRFSDRVDIWFPDRATALKFGKKEVEIVIL
ncbi:MAG: hypothetical protein A2745_01535 [Candidatus Harrisonbacteria bacterium RIFCSPHIGHO2_01_FULL_44_13]|uniref:3D domain-containing protein n=1 Tax=Candidatus Harrisonbacteria bacterium RIFCSPLOWO2_01_FULL_44_18 TaxID=1798407 RepID=A0A1G1ZKQ3_9BACT|nr:MAG: hypothetical protein A2745_01535 [Candidatus Harrisonbacteria bacterium RIFCSPHIGHO2_01_FULL_44_13]OGY65162.1 MAG: hypothetical protein A3A16_00495 [Candidatus Harrisonbacteria bacterium RIFCSPLOWO2_01_FULL_44_18]